MTFKVRGGKEFKIAALSGGVLRRSEQGLDTSLSAMGEEAIYNCVKAVVLANHFANSRRQEAPESAVVHRLGFVPTFTGDMKNQSMTLNILPLGAEPTRPVDPKFAQERILRVGPSMDLTTLKKAIFSFWFQSRSGKSGNPRIAVMGARLVSKAVKGIAAAGMDVHKSRSLPSFVCSTTMQRETDPSKPGEQMSVVYIELEGRPRLKQG